MRTLGVIIAGGKSRRFGSDKAAALLEGKALIEHVAEALRAQVDALTVAGRSWPGLPVLSDRPQGAVGPLAGLNAALHHGRDAGFDFVLSAGCDTLPVPANMAALLPGPYPAYFEGHYLLGRWPVHLADRLDAHIAQSKDRSLRGWIAQCGALSVPLPFPVWNLNTTADLESYARKTAS